MMDMPAEPVYSCPRLAPNGRRSSVTLVTISRAWGRYTAPPSPEMRGRGSPTFLTRRFDELADASERRTPSCILCDLGAAMPRAVHHIRFHCGAYRYV